MYQPFWEVIRFYATFLVLITLVLTIYYWVTIREQLQTFAQNTVAQVEASYPNDLTLEWSGSELHSTISPLVVPFPADTPKLLKEQTENFAVYTTTESETAPVDTMFLVTSTQLHDVEEGHVASGVNLSDLLGEAPLTVTKQNLPEMSEKVLNFTRSAATVAGYLFPLAAYLYFIVSSLYIALFETVIIFILIKIQRIPLSFRQLFQLSIMILVPAQIINTITLMAQLDTPVSMLTLSFWVLFIFIFFSLQRKIVRLKT